MKLYLEHCHPASSCAYLNHSAVLASLQHLVQAAGGFAAATGGIQACTKAGIAYWTYGYSHLTLQQLDKSVGTGLLTGH